MTDPQPTTATGWQPTTAAERELLAAAEQEDGAAFLAALATGPLLLPVPAAATAAAPVPWPTGHHEGVTHVMAYTSPAAIAAHLRERVRDEVGLPITVGVARTKFLAKVASAYAKPDGLLVVPVDGERAFLHPLPVERMWGVGAKTGAKLRARGIEKIGDLAAVPPHALAAYVGRAAAYHLHGLANGQDPRRVETGGKRVHIRVRRI